MPAGRGRLLTAALTAGALLPFLGKPVHVDDPLFVWAARRILVAPWDPYGFQVSWYEWAQPMHEVTKNPPLAAYLLALGGALLGWSEAALHATMLAPAVLAVLGTYRLARRLAAPPGPAAALAACTPAFAVSATTLMSDVPMLALWTWALALWIEGSERGRLLLLGLAALLAAGAGLAKYFGLGVVALMAWWTVLHRPRRWPALLLLLLPVGAAGAWQLATAALYGQGLLGEAATYASAYRAGLGEGGLSAAAVTLAFAGGSLASVGFLAPWLWSPRALGLAALLGATGTLALPAIGAVPPGLLAPGGNLGWSLLVQTGLWGVVGAGTLALALGALRQRRDPASLLLAGWVLGTVLFTAWLNWTINARTLLPMAPAVAILAARRLAAGDRLAARRRWWLIPLLPAAGLALLVAWADHGLAGSAREASRQAAAWAGPRTLWFHGHWGFQYYMERAGARPIDIRRSRLEPGQLVVAPEANTNPVSFLAGSVAPRAVILPAGAPGFIATLDGRVGAGFYAHVFGPVPFYFGPVPPQRYLLLEVLRPLGPA
jgi:4-amino-4-deoxy-L-arabinose transferase-like glycosyltransferase